MNVAFINMLQFSCASFIKPLYIFTNYPNKFSAIPSHGKYSVMRKLPIGFISTYYVPRYLNSSYQIVFSILWININSAIVIDGVSDQVVLLFFRLFTSLITSLLLLNAQ